MLTSLFYRNKAGYIIGMGVNGDQIIKMHDRVGRMADMLEYSYATFPPGQNIGRINGRVQEKVASSIVIEDDMLIIRHLYIERRLDPLNLYINFPKVDANGAMLDYAQAIQDMAVDNIPWRSVIEELWCDASRQ